MIVGGGTSMKNKRHEVYEKRIKEKTTHKFTLGAHIRAPNNLLANGDIVKQ